MPVRDRTAVANLEAGRENFHRDGADSRPTTSVDDAERGVAAASVRGMLLLQHALWLLQSKQQ